ncbi:MAG: hypothetical protein AAF585_13520 [Verrucomicrobiota bacterium]
MHATLASPAQTGDAPSTVANTEIVTPSWLREFGAELRPPDPPPDLQLQTNWLCVFRL